MNIFRLLFELFLLYMAYKLVFEFIIPVYKTTRQMKQKMADIHEKMTEANRQKETYQANTKATIITDKNSTDGDYIDYEEVK